MADSPLLGPNGQPISNPFAQQGASTNLSINTAQAEKAMEDFQRVLSNTMKSFGGSWEKTVGDRLAAEERFYRAVGDKARARQVEVIRHKDELINKINDEAKAQIAAYEAEIKAGKKTQDDLLKYKQSIADKTVSIEKDAQKKINEGGGFKGMIGKVTEFAGGVGGPIGSTVAGAGNLVTNPYSAITALLAYVFEKTAATHAAFSASGSRLANAGFGIGTGSTSAEGLTGRLRGVVGGFALSQAQETQMLESMSGSRTLIGQAKGRGGMEAFAGNLGLFANILPDVAAETALFTDATKSLGMSQKDISDMLVSSRVNADRLKTTQLDAIKVQLDMQKSLRNITNDGTVAASVLSNVSGYLDSIGASEAEKARIGLAVGQAGANLSLSQMAGMFAFTHNGKIPGPAEMFGEGGVMKGTGVFGLMGSFLNKVGSQFQDPTQRMYAADSLRQQYLPGLRLQDTPKFFDLTNAMMGGQISQEDFAKQFKDLEGKTPQAAMAAGIERLGEIVDPFTKLSNRISTFWEELDKLFDKYFGHGRDTVQSPLNDDRARKNIQKANMI